MKTNYRITQLDKDSETQSIDYIQNEDLLKKWILSKKMTHAIWDLEGKLISNNWLVNEEYFEDMRNKVMHLCETYPANFFHDEINHYYRIEPFTFNDDSFFEFKIK